MKIITKDDFESLAIVEDSGGEAFVYSLAEVAEALNVVLSEGLDGHEREYLLVEALVDAWAGSAPVPEDEDEAC